MAKLDRHQVGQSGEHFVAAELHRRGAYAVTFAGNMPNIDILASNRDRTRTIEVQVKTKTAGSWHTTTNRGEKREEDPEESRYWILVDIGKDPALPPEYWIVPEWWMLNHILTRNEEYLAEHGGRRPKSPGSKHFGITPKYVAGWHERWDLLEIF